MEDHYEILEVSANASQEDIKKQYRLLIQAWHPDKFPNPVHTAEAEARSKKIIEAYEVLSDPSKRAEYDKLRKQAGPQSSRPWQYEQEAADSKRRAEAEHVRREQEEAQRRAEAERRRREQEEIQRRAEVERKRKEQEEAQCRAEAERRRRYEEESARRQDDAKKQREQVLTTEVKHLYKTLSLVDLDLQDAIVKRNFCATAGSILLVIDLPFLMTPDLDFIHFPST